VNDMSELAIRDLITGVMEPLPGFEVTRSDTDEEGKSLKVEGTKDQFNEHGFDLVTNQNVLIYENEEYIIKDFNKWTAGITQKCDADADHRIVEDLNDLFIHETKSGTLDIETMLMLSLKDTGYTYSVDKTELISSVEVENFGGDFPINLLKSIREKFSAEWRYTGKHIFIAKTIGTNQDVILRHKYNINDPKININSSNFKTYIKGFGEKKEDGTYVVQSEYTSPLAAIYGKKEATPFSDERFKNQAALDEATRRQLNDSLPISLTFTAQELEEMGLKDTKRGDTVWCVIEPFGIDVRLRVVGKEDYSNPSKSPNFTFGQIQRTASQMISAYMQTEKIINNVVDTTTGKVKSEAVDTTNMSVNLENATGQLDESQLSFLIPPGYDLASVINDGLLSKEDFLKLSKLNVGEDGSVNIPLASTLNDGLLSSALFQKLNLIQVDQDGKVIVDLTAIEQTIQQQGQKIEEQQEQLAQLHERVTTLENPSSS